jgi:adenylate cyclase
VEGASSSPGPAPLRRLAAVSFIDIVGYSILMAEDGVRTHARWMTLLDDVVRPLTSKHRGRFVKSTGDGVLAEFPSAFDAVEWARAVQRAASEMAESEEFADGPVIALRVAVHLGDVVEAAGDIYGDGVNVAARLQEHAEPGGIVLSEAVHDLVRGALGAPARELGLLPLKNFDRPVRAYSLDPPRGRPLVPDRPSLGPLPSIAVLPLKNLGDDPADDYFSDGIIEDIIASLSGLRELLVIARSSTVTYRKQDPDVREVGRALGVRYVMTGSVRRSPRLMRVSVNLCDAHTGISLWADTLETPPGDLFEVQDEIVRRIVSGIAPHVRAEEMRRALRKRPESFTAYDFTLRALDVMNALDEGTFGKAREFLERAMAEDPHFSMPVAWAARWHSINIGQGWTADRERDSGEALRLASRAIELDPDNALALATYGHLRSRLFRDFDTALIYSDRAIAACPNSSLAWSLSSLTLAYVGEGQRAVQHAERGLRLSPLDTALFFYHTNLGCAHYAAGNYEEAVRWTKLSAADKPRFTANLRLLCAAHAGLERLGEAAAVAKEIIRLEPNFSLAHYGQTWQPFHDRNLAARFMEHLRRSGLPH